MKYKRKYNVGDKVIRFFDKRVYVIKKIDRGRFVIETVTKPIIRTIAGGRGIKKC